MSKMVDIEVILDEKYVDPKVTIYAKERTEQVDNIIEAIENVSGADFPLVPGINGKNMELLSQRDIVRIYTSGRKLIIQTDDNSYFSARTLSNLETILNNDRFIRISQSEIINIRKVKKFDISYSGTIGVFFENGDRTWASRSRVKDIKAILKKYSE